MEGKIDYQQILDLIPLPEALNEFRGQVRAESERRVRNIVWISRLSRIGLDFGTKEKEIQIHTTRQNEQIFIRYPGKESKGAEVRPWDFKPIVIVPDIGIVPNLSFGDIWGELFDILIPLVDTNDKSPAVVLARLLFRMAYMYDHVEYHPTTARYLDMNPSKEPAIIEVSEQFPAMLKYEPPYQVIEWLSKRISGVSCMSIEAFLLYNDLLAWNEDCKYFYRDSAINPNKKSVGATGRLNTLKTHINFIGVITKDTNLATVLQRASSQRGVSPASNKEISIICDVHSQQQRI